MSQAKVDKYKKEKKNREKFKKRKKIRNIFLLILGAFAVGGVIGYPLGQYLYKVSYEKRLENATIEATAYTYWVQKYWDDNYYGIMGGNYLEDIISTDTDAQ